MHVVRIMPLAMLAVPLAMLALPKGITQIVHLKLDTKDIY
jgi:cytochrome c oxidase assembly factor CtaG